MPDAGGEQFGPGRTIGIEIGDDDEVAKLAIGHEALHGLIRRAGARFGEGGENAEAVA